MRVLFFMLVVTLAWGTTWHVPGDFANIQDGLSSLSDGDTLVVAAGVYHESLHAPGVTFTWLGEVDSLREPDRPFIDPSTLENADSLSCLVMALGSIGVIADIIFRNGPEMFPHVPGSNSPGGIVHRGDHLELRRCRFDSTNVGLYLPLGSTGSLIVDSCEFADNVYGCVYCRGTGRVWIQNTEFSGGGDGGKMTWFTDSAQVEYCRFHGSPGGPDRMWAIGTGITVRNCTFGASAYPEYDAVFTGSSRGCRFEDNQFQNLELTGAAVHFGGMEGDTSYFRGNVFRNCHGLAASGSGGLLLAGQSGQVNVDVSGNLFDSCTASNAFQFGALSIQSNWTSDPAVRVYRNRFIGHDSVAPAVRVWLSSPLTTMHECLFENTGVALWANLVDTMDAEFNWWGDVSGPYHAQMNPEGLGDEIIGPVDFEPWLLDTTLAVEEDRTALPADAWLDVSPNPFNGSATLTLSVSEPGTYHVDLFNTLGQRVRELWSGYAAGEKRIAFRGEDLPSGVYIARAVQSGQSAAAALTRVVLVR